MAFNITQIVGKKLARKQTYSAELRDTTIVFHSVDASDYSDKSILINNSLNKAVEISFYAPVAPISLSTWDGEKFTTSLENQAIIPANTFASLNGHPCWEAVKLMSGFRIRIKPVESPTTGNLHIEIYGKIN